MYFLYTGFKFLVNHVSVVVCARCDRCCTRLVLGRAPCEPPQALLSFAQRLPTPANAWHRQCSGARSNSERPTLSRGAARPLP